MLSTAIATYVASRAVPRHTRCEHCGEEYVYNLERSGVGESGYGLSDSQDAANQKAAAAAVADLARELDAGVEAVPCPACFKYQAHMTEAARQEAWGRVRAVGSHALTWLPVLAVVGAFGAVIAFPAHTERAVTVVAAITLALLVVGAATALVFRFGACRPNEWSEGYRKERADALAVSRDDFDLMMLDGGPYVADLTHGQEAEYAGVVFLWVRPDEITAEATVPLELADGTEVDVELSDADDDGVFLSDDRLRGAPAGLRVCLRRYNIYTPAAPAPDPA
jgi:hypothetical protein